MRTRKFVVGVMLVTLLGSNLGLGVVPALAQTPGSGPMPVPSLTDGALGTVAPGTGMVGPYQQQPLQPQPPPVAPRPVYPGPANLGQPGPARSYQVVSVPRSRAPQPPPAAAPGTQAGAQTVTQVTVTQGAPGQVTQVPPATVAGGAAALQAQGVGTPAVEELSRIEAVFNLDPVRQFAVPMGLEQQRLGLQQQPANRQPGLQQPALQPQQPGDASGLRSEE